MAKRREWNRTLLGAAIDQRDAYLRSAWEHDYASALKEAGTGKVARLVDLLRAKRVLTEPYFDDLADYIETTAKVFHRQRNVSVHRAANLAEVFLMTAPSRSGRGSNQIVKEAIEMACEQIERRFSKGRSKESLGPSPPTQAASRPP